MDVHVTRAAELTVDRRDMKRRRRLILKFQMLDESMVTRENFRHCIREIRGIRRRDVTFHNRHAAVRAGHDQIARRHRRPGLMGRADVNKLDRRPEIRALRHLHKCAVEKKAWFKAVNALSDEGVQRPRYFSASAGSEAKAAARLPTFIHRREIFRRSKVSANNGRSRIRAACTASCRKGEFFQRPGFRAIDRGCLKHRVKRQLRERRDVREAPVFMVQRQEAQLRRTRRDRPLRNGSKSDVFATDSKWRNFSRKRFGHGQVARVFFAAFVS